MKRRDLIKHIQKQGCVFIREGTNHSIFYNPEINRVSSIPRHNEIDNYLCKKICKDLGITPLV
ncbi:MAG: type II toxin-antitoxin system HicA family toxin [Patescibacteria group bacterium]|nr:type II toxin-antitoxin system HicA family toxin [Patescibacteria group bacterium]MBU2509456.1 type II toxin-antitoxin system HicA family toxin [Patescibacteria group bacterium]